MKLGKSSLVISTGLSLMLSASCAAPAIGDDNAAGNDTVALAALEGAEESITEESFTEESFSEESFSEESLDSADEATDDAWAPAIPEEDPSGFLSQCGANDDSADVNRYAGVYDPSKATVDPAFVTAHESSTVQLEWVSESSATRILGRDFENLESNIGSLHTKGRFCSGTLVAKDLILTAGHCIAHNTMKPRYPVLNGERVGPATVAKLLQINFNYQLPVTGDDPTVNEHSFPVTELIAIGYRGAGMDTTMDYALLRFDPGDENSFANQVTPAMVLNRAPVAGESVALIQHPHGKPKKIESGSLKTSLSGIAPSASSIAGQWMYYGDLDTFGGSSGSGIRDASGAIIGVHTNGGCRKRGAGANRGLTMTSIFQHSQAIKEALLPQ